MIYKHLAAIALLALIVITTGCSRVQSNVHVLSTTNCGVDWKKLDVGATVPKHIGNSCGYNVVLPNWAMDGDTEFKTQFASKATGNATLRYSYVISNPIVFIGEARHLEKMGGSLEISAEDTDGRFEMAENIIIDKLLRKVATSITRSLEVVDANNEEIEDYVFKLAKDELEKKGVTLSDLELVIENDEKTRLAIDSAEAMRIYEAAGIKSVGDQLETDVINRNQ